MRSSTSSPKRLLPFKLETLPIDEALKETGVSQEIRMPSLQAAPSPADQKAMPHSRPLELLAKSHLLPEEGPSPADPHPLVVSYGIA